MPQLCIFYGIWYPFHNLISV